jgi:hypothetical protein
LHAGCLILRINVICGLLLICTGCAARRQVAANWRLTRQGTADILIPPGVSKPDLATRTLAVDLAASPRSGQNPCPATIRVKGKRAFVTVTHEMLLEQPPGWLTAWAAGIESQGCIAPGEGFALATRIAESLPLDPALAFHLLNRDDRQTGMVDLGPQSRLQVVSPVESVAADAPIVDISGNPDNLNLNVTVKSAADLKGYETAWYALQPKAQGTGFTIVAIGAERHIGGETERRPQPATNYFQFAPDAAFYRLFYKGGNTSFTALVVAAPTRAELDRRTSALDADTASCKTLNRELCVEIPRIVGLNPMIAVTVNGTEVRVGPGASVGVAIRSSGELRPEAILPELAISRLYNGRPAPVDFDHSSSAILRLTLMGGEIISWNK